MNSNRWDKPASEGPVQASLTGMFHGWGFSPGPRLTSYGVAVSAKNQANANTGYRTPYQEIPIFNASRIEGSLQNYSNLLSQLSGAGTQYDLTARPVTWQDIQAQQTSATAGARAALAFTEAELPRFNAVARELTQADIATRENMLDQFVPQWRTQRDTAAAINDAMMRGEVPRDVANKLQRDAAFVGMASGGYGGGANIRSVTARDLGLTSLDLQQKGMAGAERWTALMSGLMPKQTLGSEIMASQGLTSQQVIDVAIGNADRQLRADTTNVQGRTQTALENERLRLQGEGAKTDRDISRASTLMTGFGNILTAQTELEKQKYIAQTKASEIAYQNMQNIRPTLVTRSWERGGTLIAPKYDYSNMPTASQYGFGIR